VLPIRHHGCDPDFPSQRLHHRVLDCQRIAVPGNADIDNWRLVHRSGGAVKAIVAARARATAIAFAEIIVLAKVYRNPSRAMALPGSANARRSSG
jgi:hypothetical protein